MKGGFEQLPNYIKGIGEPGCTPDFFRLLAETTGSCRRRIIVHRQEPVHRRLPQRATATPDSFRPFRHSTAARIFSFRCVILEPHPREGCWLSRTITDVPPTRIVRLRNPGFPNRGFFVTAFEFALSAVSAGPQLSDWNGSPIERVLIPANKLGYLVQSDPEFRRHVFRVGKPVAVFCSKATRRI
jgi:hypothetical protein